MFPLSFPKKVLETSSSRHNAGVVVDPFCGRGTTNFAARLFGYDSFGVDSSIVATAIAESKLVNVSPEEIIATAKGIINSTEPTEIPESDFWEMLYSKVVLRDLCKLREELIYDCKSNARKALRGIIIGALHGPIPKTKFSYFSNQCPRTYSPKPDYSLRFWKKRNCLPPEVDVLSIIEERAKRFFSSDLPNTSNTIVTGDSRKIETFHSLREKHIEWIITSPPYFGMRTYVQDQWIRYWFLGGPPKIDYSVEAQLGSGKKLTFIKELNKVWKNLSEFADEKTALVIRCGSIRSKYIEALGAVEASLEKTGWKITRVDSAGTSDNGKRQADTFLKDRSHALDEIDVWAVNT